MPPPLVPDPLLERAIALLQKQQQLLAQRSILEAHRSATMRFWLLPLLATAAVASLIAAALPLFLDRRMRRALAASAAATRAIDAKLDSAFRSLADATRHISKEVAENVARAGESSNAGIASIGNDLGELRERFRKLLDSLEGRNSSNGDAVRLERQVLAEHWKHFVEKKELGDAASQEDRWDQLLVDLQTLVPNDLRPSLDAVLTPWRDHRLLIQKIGIIPHVIKGQMGLGSEAAELKRARELTQLLISVQSDDGSSRFQFAFHDWVTGTFLPFADLYLQSYQKAQFEKRDAGLHQGMSVVREILQLAMLKPIEVTLGETRFDSTRHIGRFTSSDPQLPDGVITGVVRNGFVEADQSVIRQPEVVVNRVR